MATSMQFDMPISCFASVKWSRDSRISLCGDDALKILTLLPVVDNCSELPHFQHSFIQPDNSVYNIPKLTETEYGSLVSTLSREEHDIMITDTVMNPNSPTTVARRGFSAAEWSPRGGDEVDRCILAGLSHDFRLCVFSQRSSTYDWYKVCDLTDEYGKTHTFDGNKVESFHRFSLHCRDQAVVTISWCALVFTRTITGHRESEEQKYSILATGSKTGNIVLWKINLPCLNESDCSILHEVKPISKHPSYMTWSERSGLLAVGYTDGQIYVLKINISDPSEEPTVVSVHSESDLMRISCLSVVSHPEEKSEIVLANKEQHLLAFTVSVGQKIEVLSETCIEARNMLHGTGFAGNQELILMSSADGIIQHIQLGLENNSLQLSTKKLEIDVNSVFQLQKRTKSSCSYSWLIHGVASSSNNIYMAYVARPSSPFDRYQTRRSTLVQILPLHGLLENTQTGISHNEETQTAPRVVAVDTDQRMLNLLKGDTVQMYMIIDILERFRSQCYSLKDGAFEKENLMTLSLKELKLKRYQYLITYHTKCKKPSEKPVSASYLTTDEIQEQEKTKKHGSELLLHIDKFTELIAGIQIKSAVECLFPYRTKIEKNNQVNKSLKRMLDFISSRPWLMEIKPELSSAANDLKQLLTNTDVKPETCLLCSSCLTHSALTATCENGHSFSMCSKTLLLCDNMDYRTCSICHCLALSKLRLKDFPWLPGDENSCNLCDGQLL